MSTESWRASRLPMIGRTEFESIMAGIVSGASSRILLLEGMAGIGKTMLLEAASIEARKMGTLCPPVVDFYDTRMHSHQGLEAAIAEVLGASRESAFQAYWRRRASDPQADLWEEFLQGYRIVADEHHILLRFDTAERLVYERDSEDVLRGCGVNEQDAPSWDWLLERSGVLPNTSVIIAARPTSEDLLRKRLVEVHQGRLLVQEVTGFRLAETEAYFRATEFGTQMANASPEIVGTVQRLTSGRPILLSLALDWLQRGIWDRAQLEVFQPPDFERSLVEQVRRLTSPLDEAVRYASLCRKGCNAELLARLMGIRHDRG